MSLGFGLLGIQQHAPSVFPPPGDAVSGRIDAWVIYVIVGGCMLIVYRTIEAGRKQQDALVAELIELRKERATIAERVGADGEVQRQTVDLLGRVEVALKAILKAMERPKRGAVD